MSSNTSSFSLCTDQTIAALIAFAHDRGVSGESPRIAAAHLIKIARRRGGKANFESAVQGGAIAFMRSVEKYNSDLGIPFAAFAQKSLYGAVCRATDQDCVHASGSNDGSDEDDVLNTVPAREKPVPECMVDHEVMDGITEFLSTLPANMQLAANPIYVGGESRAHVSRVLGVSRMAVTKTMQRVAVRAVITLKPFVDAALVA